MSFGQLVVGPPGSGKTTYCLAMQQHLEGLGRKVVVVSLDPANVHAHICHRFVVLQSLINPMEILQDGIQPDVDVRDLIQLSDATERLGLGPNGGLVFCIEYLASNLEWLKEAIDSADEGTYFLFDCPGQVSMNSCAGPREYIHQLWILRWNCTRTTKLCGPCLSR